MTMTNHQNTLPPTGESEQESKRALLDYFLAQAGVETREFAELPSISPRAQDGPAPLSYAQEGLWFLDQFQPESPAYTMPAVYRVRGELQADLLERSLQEIVRRHEILRTTFSLVDGQAVQVIAPASAFALARVDLRAYAEGEQEAQRLIAAEIGHVFDLASGPLLRATLLCLTDQEHLFILTVHHLISDGWSSEIFFRELAALYTGLVNGTPARLGALPLQYADVAAWQRTWLQGERLEQLLAHWKEQLAGAPAVLDLPTDYPRPAVQRLRGAATAQRLPRELADALRQLSREEETTLFMTMLAAFTVLLYRYSGQQDVVVGSAAAGRTLPETEALIGLFVNTLALRTSLAGRPSFRELLGRVRATTLEAFAHQDLPFELLVQALAPARNPGYNPLFQVMFAFTHASADRQTFAGLTWTPLDQDPGTAKFDLSLYVQEQGQELDVTIVYNTELFATPTITRMLEHFRLLLQGCVANPDCAIDDLPLLPAAERQQVLVTWNQTGSAYPRQRCIHELFEAEVTRHPQGIAAYCQEQALTYQALNHRANQLARTLQSLGVGPAVRVGLCLERSLEMLVGMLAILKAGAAYVPLDPTYPAERLAFLLRNTQAPVLLTRRQLRDRLPAHHAQVLCLDDPDVCARVAQQSAANLPCRITPGHLAYVMYTSGSTGQPKGVSIPHRGVVRLVRESGFARLTGDEVFLALAPISFDASTFEIWAPLLNGGRVVVFPPHTPSTEELGHVLGRFQVTTLWLTAGLFHQMVEHHPQGLAGVRQLLAGGDVLSASHVRRVLEAGTVECLINGYGPTENTTFTCCYPMTAPPAQACALPIGRPIAQTRVYILDARLQPVPIGVRGELYIGGDGLALDYLGRPDLTAERFLPDPWSAEPGARLYRSGDLARYLDDGVIQFLGRTDTQVKVRGFRIETGEIEAALTRHPEVRQAAVVAREDPSGAKRLVAYLVSAPGAHLPIDEVRTYLADTLPEYMLPSACVLLERLPLTPNGKVDHGQLPAPDSRRPLLQAAFVPASTPIEQALASLWAAVLGLEQVGVRDNFFALGGDSIRSIQLRALARQQGLHFSLQQLFRAQTIEQLARELREPEDAAQPPAPAVRPFQLISSADRQCLPEEIEDAYPLTMLQAGMLYHIALTPEVALYHNVLSMHIRAPFARQALEEAVQRAIDRHPVLRTSFEMTACTQPLQLVHRRVRAQMSCQDLSGADAGEQERAVLAFVEEQKRHPLDLTRAPLLHFHIHRRSATAFQLTVVLSHAILDGWSLFVTLAEIFEDYLARSAGEALPARAPAGVAFRDFVWLEKQALASEECRAYWRRQLAGCSVMQLPRWPCAYRTGSGERMQDLRSVFAQDVYAGLQQLAARASVPLKSVLLAAHLKVLSVLGGQSDVLTGLTSEGRPEEIGGEQAPGLFLNVVPLRLRLGDGSWIDLARAAFETERELLPFRRYPLAQIQKDLGGQSLFSSVFTFEHFHSMARNRSLEIVDTLSSGDANFAISADFGVDPFSEQLALRIGFDAEAFDPRQMAAIMGYYQNVLASMAADPQQCHATCCLLSPDEYRQLVVAWNGHAACGEQPESLPRLFEARVARTPDAIALSCRGAQVTYRELNAHANRLARRLRQQGVGPETLVALLLERGIPFITALLAVFKAGGAFLPLDPAYPVARALQVVRQSGCTLLLTTQAPRLAELQAALEKQACPALYLEEAWRQESNAANLPVWQTPSCLAYVMYTSGSTGVPKGAMVHVAGMLNHIAAKSADVQLSASDVLAQNGPPCFDIVVWQCLAALLVGGRAAVLGEEEASDPARLLQALQEQGISVLQVVPSMLRALVQEIEEQDRTRPSLPSLRWVVPTGDALPTDLCRQWLQLYPSIPLLNTYGSTECSDDQCHLVIRQGAAWEAELPIAPIGRPIPQMQAYVLDHWLLPVPIGVTGELYIGGRGVGRGYRDDALRTAEAFFADPFSATPGARLYRTGDLARVLPDGTLEFLGRADHLVKVRGHRIEPGEIEQALRDQPMVREAVVVAQERRPGEKTLVAYVVPEAQACRPQEPGRRLGEDQEYVGQWQEVYNGVYAQDARTSQDPTVNRRVWTSSYTGQPLPDEEITECIEDTVARIRALAPRRVLEIGCGTGQLYFRIAPYCLRYDGTDISAEALRGLERQRSSRADLPETQLLERAADDLSGYAPGSYDLVILNEVVQYFPSIAYLMRVIEEARRLLTPGGRIFLGGIRSLRLLAAFHTSVQLHQAPDSLTLAQFQQRIQQKMLQDRELVIDPAFFHALRRHWPQITDAQVALKGGRHPNEFTRFRYDVLLSQGEQEPAPETLVLPWEQLTLSSLRQLLQEQQPQALLVTAVPNARLENERRACLLLEQSACSTHVGELKGALAAENSATPALFPQAFWELGDVLPYHVQVSWTDTTDGTTFDVLLTRHRPGERASQRAHWAPWPAGSPGPQQARPWEEYASAPLAARTREQLGFELHHALQTRLPEYMLPARFVFLDALPLSANGKIDRKALPRLASESPDESSHPVAPRNELEEILADIFADALGVEQVGVHDNFFERGGHSLLATRVISRIRKFLPAEPSVRTLFESPTVARFALALASDPVRGRQIETAARILLNVAQLSEAQVQAMVGQGATENKGVIA